MDKTGLICGGSQGIGLALTQQLLKNNQFSLIIATYRPESNMNRLIKLKNSFDDKLMLVELEATSEESVSLMVEKIISRTKKIHLVINCIGFLYSNTFTPEKSITDITSESLTHSFQINAATTLLLAKHLKLLLLYGTESVFISLSAKVGSIDDNSTGGWYSYRVSKAALNMSIKNISIEFNRLSKKCIVFAVHPGTTETRLSAPFLKNALKKYKVHKPTESAVNILNIVNRAENKTHNGKFFSWNGEQIQW